MGAVKSIIAALEEIQNAIIQIGQALTSLEQAINNFPLKATAQAEEQTNGAQN